MYEITLNGKTLYHPNSDDCIVTNAVIHEALKDSGYMDITVPHVNPLYDELTERKGKIIVYKNNVEWWYGEIRDIGKDFSKNKTLYIVGEASYLNDSVQPQKEYKDKTKYQVFQSILESHNAQVEEDRRFEPGLIGKGANSYVHIVTDWEYSLDAIRKHLCGDDEYVKITHEVINGKNTRCVNILPLDDYGKHSEQVIAFGENLLDYAEQSYGEDIATVCIPLGVQLEEEKIEGYTNYLTCEAANDGKNFVELPGAIARLGRIRKIVHFNVLNTPEALLTAANNYLKEYQYAKLTLNLSAVDLSMLSTDIDSYALGDYVNALCEPLGMSAWFPIREKETDLLNLANNSIKIGADGSRTFTQQQTDNYIELERETELSKNSAVQASLRNARQMMNSNGEDGYVSIRLDENDKPYEIVIADKPTLKQSTNAWRWNLSGFGHGKKAPGADEFEWTPDVAITMDGAIVADAITTGTLTAIEINNGSGTFRVTKEGAMTSTSGYIAGFKINKGVTLDGVLTDFLECSSSNGNNSILIGHKPTTGASVLRLKRKNGWNEYGSAITEDYIYVYKNEGTEKGTKLSPDGVVTDGTVKVNGNQEVATKIDLNSYVDATTFNNAINTINTNFSNISSKMQSINNSISDLWSEVNKKTTFSAVTSYVLGDVVQQYIKELVWIWLRYTFAGPQGKDLKEAKTGDLIGKKYNLVD